jgi:hypothetical protein
VSGISRRIIGYEWLETDIFFILLSYVPLADKLGRRTIGKSDILAGSGGGPTQSE